MLKQVYMSESVPYAKSGNKYIQTVMRLNGLTTKSVDIDTTKYATATSPASLYLWVIFGTTYPPYGDFGQFRYDGTTGKRLDEQGMSGGGVGNLWTISGQIVQSRKGQLWSVGYYGDVLWKVGLGATAEALPFQEPPPPKQGWGVFYGEELTTAHFQTMILFGLLAIDDVTDRFISVGGLGTGALTVWQMSTGKLIYNLNAFAWEGFAAVCLEDTDHIYILGQSGRLILYDYARGEVLGVAMMPPRPNGSTNYASLQTLMTWDPYYRRILIAEQTPDNPDGTSTCRIRGYRLVPEPVRMTTPIPLKVPRQGRLIPVLTQVVGESNEGVSGYLVNATVTGSGSLAGIITTNHWGEAKIPVATEGYVSFTGASDWATTGSPEATPPHAGLVTVKAWVEVVDVAPEDLPKTGTGSAVPRPPGDGRGGEALHVWDWNPLGGPDPVAPGSQPGAPADMAGWEAYFFGLISRAKGGPANDWEAVLNGLKGQGMRVNMQANEVPQTSWPFYGMHLVLVSDAPVGKVALPTAVADTSGKYLQEVWVIKVDTAGGGGGGSSTEQTAPNMNSILDRVFQSRTWNLAESNQYAPDGRGAFTEAVVTACHDVDARFGHVDKGDGTGSSPNRYNGHSVDAINFKCDDGVTAEIYDIVSGETGDYGMGDMTDRTADNLDRWKYPA